MNTNAKATVAIVVALIAAVLIMTAAPSSSAANIDMDDLLSDGSVSSEDSETYTSTGISFSQYTNFDLLGKTLVLSSGGITSSSGLTINDSVGGGKIVSEEGNTTTTITITKSSLTINAGTIESNGIAVQMNSGSFTMNGGTIKATDCGIHMSGTGSTISMNGGSIAASVGINQEVGKNLNLNGGSIVVTGDYAVTSSATNIDVLGTSMEVTDGVAFNTVNDATVCYTDIEVTGSGAAFSSSEGSTISIYGGDFPASLIDSESLGSIMIYGGKFAAAPDQSCIVGGQTYKDGYVQSSSQFPTITTQNGVGFDSIYLAIMALPISSTETLTINSPIEESNSLTIPAGRDVTIDINSNDVILEGTVYVNADAKLTLKNSGSAGSITCTEDGNDFQILSGGEMNVNDVDLKLIGKIMVNGEFTMDGGNITGPGNTNGLIYSAGTSNIIDGNVIADGEFAMRKVSSTGNITIGGNGNAPYISSLQIGSSVTLIFNSGTIGSVKGTISASSVLNGLFGTDVSDSLPTGKGCVERDGGWAVVDVTTENAVASIGDTYFASFSSALRGIKDGDTLVLLKDYEGTGSTVSAKSFTIDFNGHSFNNTGNGAAITIDANMTDGDGTVTFTNSQTVESLITSAATVVKVETKNHAEHCLTITIDEDVVLRTSDEGSFLELSGNSRIENTAVNGSYVTHGGFEATVNGIEYIYGDLLKALQATSIKLEGAETPVVVLHSDYSYGINLGVKGTWALDLGGHTLSSSGNYVVNITDSEVDLIIMNGSIIGTSTAEGSGGIGLSLPPSQTIPNQSPVSYSGSSVVLDGVNMAVAGTYGILTNGTCTDMGITLINSEIEGADYGIYFPSSGSVTITDSTVSGNQTGIEIRAGSLTVEGDKTVIRGGDLFTSSPNGNGTTTTGVAIAVSQHTTNLSISVAVKGGTFEGAYAFYEEDLQDETTGSISLSVTGGTFRSPVYSENVRQFISNPTEPESMGPSFSTDVTEYCADSLGAVKGNDGMYTLTSAYKITFIVNGETVAVISNTGGELVLPEIEGVNIQWDLPALPITADTTVTGTIESLDQPAVSISGENSIIDSDSTHLTGSYTGSVPSDLATVTYTWTLPDGSTKSGSEIDADSPGKYGLDVKVSYMGKEIIGSSSVAVLQMYTVVFMNGATEIYRTTVAAGQTFTGTVDAPQQSGYLFNQWLTENGQSISVPINAPTMFYADMKPLTPGLIVASGDSYNGQSVSLDLVDDSDVITVLWYYSDTEFALPTTSTLLDEPVATKTGYYVAVVEYADGTIRYGMEHIVFTDAPTPEPSPGYPTIPGDDDDVYIPPTVVVDQNQSDDNDAVKVAACAAAAVAAAVLAVLAIALYRKD